MSNYALLSFETIKLILENNEFTYACFAMETSSATNSTCSPLATVWNSQRRTEFGMPTSAICCMPTLSASTVLLSFCEDSSAPQ